MEMNCRENEREESEEEINKSCSFLKGLTLEPMVLMFAFGMYISGLTEDQMVFYKTCRDPLFNNTEDFCENIESFVNTTEYSRVEEEVAEFMNIISVMKQVVPIILAFYVGSLSDQYGRKPFILICITCKLFREVMNCLNAVFLSWSRWVWLATVPTCDAVSGGWMVLVMVTNAFIVDNSSPRQRTLRLGAISGCFHVARPAATALGGVLYKVGGFVLVLSVGGIFYFLAWSYAFLRLWHFQEVVGNGKNMKTTSLIDIIHPRHILDTVKVIFKPRSDLKRCFLVAMFFIFLIDEFHDQGELIHEFLFTKRIFSWTVSDYSWFKTVDSVSTSVGTVTLFPLLYYFKATDNIIILIALASVILSNMIRGLSKLYTTFYLSILVDFPNGMLAAPCRSQISQCVSPSELGKILSLLASMQSAIPIIASNTYTRVYTYTRTMDYPLPGSCYFLSCLALLVAATVTITVSFILKCGRIPLAEDRKSIHKY